MNTKFLIIPYIRKRHSAAFIITFIIMSCIFTIKFIKFLIIKEKCNNKLNDYDLTYI